MIRNIKASQKLYLLALVMSAFIIGIGMYGICKMRIMNRNTQTLYADRVIPLQQLTSMRFAYAAGILSAAEQAQSSQFSFTEAIQLIDHSEKSIAANWKDYQLTYLTPRESEFAKQLAVLMSRSNITIEKLKQVLNKKDIPALDRTIKNELYPILNPVTSKLSELIELQVKVSGDIYQNSTQVYNKAYSEFLLLILLSLLFVIPFSYYLIRSVKNLIKDLIAGNIKITEAEERFSKAFQSAPVAITATRLSDGKFYEVNQSFEKFFEYHKSELIGKTINELNIWIDPTDRNYLLDELATKGFIHGHDFRFRTKTGRVVTATYSGEVIELSGVKCILSVLVDITDRKKTEEALLESEKKYRNIFENVQDVFYQVSLDGIIIEGSPSIYQLIGFTREELIGKPAGSIYYYPEDREKWIQVLIEKGEVKEFEVYFKTRSGEPRFVSVNAHLIKDKNGNPSHFDGVMRNITERKKAEENLIQSEARLREAQQIAHIGNWEIDMIRNISSWSDELYQIFGEDKELFHPSIEGFLSFLYPEDREEAEKRITQIFSSLTNTVSNFRFLKKDGSERFAHMEWRFEFDQRNNPIRSFGILQDVTERKKAQESIKQSEANYRQLFTLSPVPMCVFDKETYQFLQVNQACISHYGYSAEEFAKMTIMDITSVTNEQAVRNTGNTLFIGGQKHINKSGEILDVEVSSIPLVLNGKNYVLMVAIDVTEKNQYEQKLTRAAIKAQEDERYEIGGELHDNVCQILASALIYLGIMKKYLSDDSNTIFNETHEYITLASQEIRSLSHRLAPAFFDDATLEDAFKNLLNSFNIEKKYQITLYFDEASKTWPISRELQLNLYRIVQEQLRNIAKHANASGISVNVGIHNKLLQMSIADDGVGFDVESKKGGIGLANMNRRAQLFSGNFMIHSMVGKGSEVIVEIPLS